MTRLAAAMLVLALTLPACAGDGGTPPVDPGTPLLRIEWTGGFAPIELHLTSGPAHTLTRDGLLIFPAAVPAIYPGPTVTPYLAVQVTAGELRQLESILKRIGLPDMTDEFDDTAAGFVADAQTMVFTYWDGNGAHRYSVYALGMWEVGDPGVEIPEASELAYELVRTLDAMTGREIVRWEPERIQVLAMPGTIEPDFEDHRDWILAGDLDGWTDLGPARCTMLDVSALGLFTDTTQATTYDSPDPDRADVVRLVVRPLHPGETGCVSPA